MNSSFSLFPITERNSKSNLRKKKVKTVCPIEQWYVIATCYTHQNMLNTLIVILNLIVVKFLLICWCHWHSLLFLLPPISFYKCPITIIFHFSSSLFFSSCFVIVVLGVIDFFFFLVGSVNSFNGRSPEKKRRPLLPRTCLMRVIIII